MGGMARYYKDADKKWFDLGRAGQYGLLAGLAVGALVIAYLALNR